MRTREQVGADILLTHAAEQVAALVGDEEAEKDAVHRLDDLYAEYVAIPQQRTP